MRFVWPIISVILLIILVGVVAFFMGKQSINTSSIITSTDTVQKEDKIGVSEEIQNLTSTPQKTKTIEAGGVLSFPKYVLTLPEGWESQREQGENSDLLTLSKLGYKITISEGAFGGMGCIYSGDTPSEMAQSYDSYIEIINPNGFVFRKSMSGPNGYTVCQKGSDGSFGTPTIFGHMSFTTPGTPDKNAIILPEVDSILISLNKKQ